MQEMNEIKMAIRHDSDQSRDVVDKIFTPGMFKAEVENAIHL